MNFIVKRNPIMFNLQHILVTLHLKPLCIMHYKCIHDVDCNALHLFINNCNQSENALLFEGFVVLSITLSEGVTINRYCNCGYDYS